MQNVSNHSAKRLHAADIAAVIVALAGIFARPSTAGDPGVGWHLKTGEWILTQRAIPHVDPFLLSSGDKPWVATQWLADVLLTAVYQLAGFSLLHLLTIALFLISHLLIPGGVLRRASIPPLIAMAALLLGAMIGSVQWIVRPVLLGFVCFAIAYAHAFSLWERKGTSTLAWRDIIGAPILFVCWANLHSSFPLGLFLYFIALFLPKMSGTETRVTLRLAFFALLTGATCLNPYGLALHQNMFGLVDSQYFMSLNKEWLSPDFQAPEFARIAVIFAVLFFGALLGFANRVSLFEAVAAVLFVFLSLQSRRYLPFCAITLTIVIARELLAATELCAERWRATLPNLASLLLDWQTSLRTIPIATTLIVALTTLFVLTTDHLPARNAAEFSLDAHYPARVLGQLDVVKDSGRAIFHSPNYGGYITWRFFPRIRAFIDDRNELNGESRYREYYAVVRMEAGWRQIVDRHRFEWLLLDKSTTLAKYLHEISGNGLSQLPWKVLAQDEAVVLYERVTTPDKLNSVVTE